MFISETPWVQTQTCDISAGLFCNPDDSKERTCCYQSACRTLVDLKENFKKDTCPEEGKFPCHSVHYSQYSSGSAEDGEIPAPRALTFIFTIALLDMRAFWEFRSDRSLIFKV